jgi:MSHA biogenesis protein MshI
VGLFPFLDRKDQRGLTAVGLEADGVAVARVERERGRAQLARAEFLPWGERPRDKVLAEVAGRYHLDRERCTTVLESTDYTLLLTEAPDVPADELRAALRWRVKDLIDFHINDATLDVFDVPGERVAGRPRPMYAVAARSAAVQSRVDLLSGAGIGLDVIDIAELAQRNLAMLLPEDARGVALLSLKPATGLLTVTRGGELYLSRGLDIGLDLLRGEELRTEFFDRIALEIQRSLDYYESQLRQAPVAALALAPLVEPLPQFTEHLRANLGVPVIEMNLTQLIECRAPLDAERQWRCLGAIGAALRHEESAL